MWKVRVFTLYPEMFPGPLASGLYKKALEKKIWSLEVVNIRDYATDKHKTVDDTPFGGGSGMVMKADVLANSLDKNIINNKEPVIYLSPKGKKDELMKKFKEFFDNMKGTDGLISMKLIQTGPNNMCTIGEWKDEQLIAKARDKMIAGLDTVRPLLDEISPELGVTDPVSGPVIMEDK